MFAAAAPVIVYVVNLFPPMFSLLVVHMLIDKPVPFPVRQLLITAGVPVGAAACDTGASFLPALSKGKGEVPVYNAYFN